jgi:hypothetical protein
MKTVKSTVNINKENMDNLKKLVSEKVITSLTDGINEGLDMLIKSKKKELYAKQLEAAAKDKNFLERTLTCQREFDNIESGAPGEW